MTEMQQILEYLKKLEEGQNQILARVENLENNATASKEDISDIRSSLNVVKDETIRIKIDTTKINAKTDIIINKLDTTVNSTIEEENALKVRVTTLEKQVSQLMRSHPL
jgi:predicted  nucleic acid-binding Zn-ribbon protein